jgi:hypothetical protein
MRFESSTADSGSDDKKSLTEPPPPPYITLQYGCLRKNDIKNAGNCLTEHTVHVKKNTRNHFLTQYPAASRTLQLYC